MSVPGQEGHAAGLRVLPTLIVITDWCAGFFGALTLVLEHERTRQQPPSTIFETEAERQTHLP
jgi:hypothetical protein